MNQSHAAILMVFENIFVTSRPHEPTYCCRYYFRTGGRMESPRYSIASAGGGSRQSLPAPNPYVQPSVPRSASRASTTARLATVTPDDSRRQSSFSNQRWNTAKTAGHPSREAMRGEFSTDNVELMRPPGSVNVRDVYPLELSRLVVCTPCR